MCSLTQAVTKPVASASTDAQPRRSLGDALLLKPNQMWTPLSISLLLKELSRSRNEVSELLGEGAVRRTAELMEQVDPAN
eukprot:4810209-Pleurochrysis_carterae.AAC.1